MEKKYIFISTEHFSFINPNELNVDFNDLMFSKDNNEIFINWYGETPKCIQELIKQYEYTIYTPEQAMNRIELMYNG